MRVETSGVKVPRSDGAKGEEACESDQAAVEAAATAAVASAVSDDDDDELRKLIYARSSFLHSENVCDLTRASTVERPEVNARQTKKWKRAKEVTHSTKTSLNSQLSVNILKAVLREKK